MKFEQSLSAFLLYFECAIVGNRKVVKIFLLLLSVSQHFIYYIKTLKFANPILKEIVNKDSNSILILYHGPYTSNYEAELIQSLTTK
jgi:hypothetical protein